LPLYKLHKNPIVQALFGEIEKQLQKKQTNKQEQQKTIKQQHK
jgi:hypothetical protein